MNQPLICKLKLRKHQLAGVLFFARFSIKENEVIENSFEVFLKTPNYDQKKQAYV